MIGDARCPRCGGRAQPPSAWSTVWRCDRHGEIVPLRRTHVLSADSLAALAHDARVPVWLPWPLPAGWLVTGIAAAGDDRSGVRGAVVALSGPSPVGGPGEMMLVSEDPGVGLGAYCAGLDGPDPGESFAADTPYAQVEFGHHEFPLWLVDAPDQAVVVGEVLGSWLWIVLWPETAGALLAEPEPLALRDLRDPGQDLDIPFGPGSPRLPG